MAESSHPSFPIVRQVMLDTTDARGLAEFYRAMLGGNYRPGDEPPATGESHAADWLVLRNPAGGVGIALQQVEQLTASTWPRDETPQQLHLDTTVASNAQLDEQHDRVLRLGAKLLLDRSDDEEEPLRVYADPAGHPFCIFVA